MNTTLKNSKLGALAATLGMVLALGGTSYAVAQSGSDIGGSRASVAETSEAASYAVLARSWVRWSNWADEPVPVRLPQDQPRYSQVNLETRSEGSGGPISVPAGHAGQAHVEASIVFEKEYSPLAPATVTCNLRMTGQPMGDTFVDTLPAEPWSRMTMALVGSRGEVPAGPQNVGVACWTAHGEPPVVMQRVDLHVVVYDEPA